MRVCTNCGASVREGARFCTACGTRLNDVSSSTTPDAWSNPADQTLVAPAIEPTESHDVEPESTQTPAEADGGFSWSWGSTAASEPEGEDQVSVESGDVPEDSGSESVATPATVDATEAEVLADDPAVSDEPAAEVIPDDAEPVSDDASTAEAQDAIDDTEDTTLAAWAGQWDDDDVEGAASEPVEPVAETDMVAESGSDGGEDADPVSRAQELLAELQALIPQFANPASVATSAVVASVAAGNPPVPDGLLDQLDAADSGGSFDDVRDVIATVQANPRDVDSMLKLANSAERLRDLLDNRDTLAAGALAVRAWIRDQDTSGEDDGDLL